MKRLILLTFLTINYCYGQKIQHEPRKIFVSTLNVPKNTRNSNIATKKYAIENKLKRLICYRDDSISSDLRYDKIGNIILKIENENNIIRKSRYEFDSKDRLIKVIYYDWNDNIKYGYTYEFTDNAKLSYNLIDKTLINKKTTLKPENIEISTDFNQDGTVKSKTIKIFNENSKLQRKIDFFTHPDNYKVQQEHVYYNKDGLRYEDEFYYIENKGKTSKTKLSKDSWIKDDNGNLIKHINNNFLISEHNYNAFNRLISSKYYSYKDGLWKTESFTYKNDTLLVNKIVKYIRDNFKITYDFSYDKYNKLEKVKKSNGVDSIIFRYEYEYY